MNELKAILSELHPEFDLIDASALVDDGILDSFDIVMIISEIYASFDVEVPPEEITPENFNSLECIYQMLQRHLDD